MQFENMSPSDKDAYIAAWNDTCYGLKESVEHNDVDFYIEEIVEAINFNKALRPCYKQGISDALETFQSGTMPQKKKRLSFDELNG